MLLPLLFFDVLVAFAVPTADAGGGGGAAAGGGGGGGGPSVSVASA